MINNTIQTGVNINVTKQRLDFAFLVIWELRKKVHEPTVIIIYRISDILWKKVKRWKA